MYVDDIIITGSDRSQLNELKRLLENEESQ